VKNRTLGRRSPKNKVRHFAPNSKDGSTEVRGAEPTNKQRASGGSFASTTKTDKIALRETVSPATAERKAPGVTQRVSFSMESDSKQRLVGFSDPPVQIDALQ
jgi:hypothetical protein